MSATLRRGAPDEAGFSGPALENVSTRAREWVRGIPIPTLVLLASRRGVVAYHEAFGRLGPGDDEPETPLDAIFRIASITKLLTATALMKLVEEGRVGIHRPVVTYIPEFHGEGKDGVLVRHLLTHTSGIREEELEKFATGAQGSVTIPSPEPTLHPWVNEHLALRYGCPLWKAPGSEMSYCDFNFDLCGEIIRRVSGIPFDRYVEQSVLRPLGMKDTHCCRVDGDSRRRVKEPEPVSEALQPPRKLLETERIAVGSGFAISTAFDLAVLCQMFLNQGVYDGTRILSPATVNAMTRNQIPGVGAEFFGTRFREASWGLGWSVHGDKVGGDGTLYSAESFEHWGAGGTYCWADPRRAVVGVYFSAIPWVAEPGANIPKFRNDIYTDMVTAAVLDE